MASKKYPNFKTLEELRESEYGHYIIDRSTHPHFYVSSWPVGYGHTTLQGRESYRLPHLNYNSVLVIVLSNEYAEGSWWRLQNMLRYTEDAGFTVAFEELDDMSTLPADAIGIMRACGSMLALDSGFEWCLMVDTDTHLEEDTLVNLIACDRPVVFPLIHVLDDLLEGAVIMNPHLRPDQGIQPVVWAAMSVMLFNTRVFNCLAPYAWHGHDYHFAQQLAHYGHRIHVDTDSVVNVTRGPSRHPSKDWDDLFDGMKAAHNSRQREHRDRRPPPDFDPAFERGVVDEHGVYWALDKWKYGGVNGPMHYAKEPDATE